MFKHLSNDAGVEFDSEMDFNPDENRFSMSSKLEKGETK